VLFAGAGAGAGEADAGIVVGNLRCAIANEVPASIGHSCFPADGITTQELLDEADRRLYIVKGLRTSKRGGVAAELSWAAALADAVDRRMNGEHHHSRAVAGYAFAIASRLGWTEPRLGLLRLAATLHDVGKVAIPDRILNKPAALGAAEYAEIKRHVTVGAEMISRIDGLEEIVPWVRHSHEHLDGSGYPDGRRRRDTCRVAHPARRRRLRRDDLRSPLPARTRSPRGRRRAAAPRRYPVRLRLRHRSDRRPGHVRGSQGRPTRRSRLRRPDPRHEPDCRPAISAPSG
jgi:putative nucleotidyltransferase with HDIG domain